MIAQKTMIADEALGQRHRQRSSRVREQPQDKGALAPDQIADLAADQDERSRDECLQRDRRLNAAHGRVEVIDDGRDRDVHQRRVDDEHEHRHRQQKWEPPARRARGRCDRLPVLGHLEPELGADSSRLDGVL